MPLLGWSQHMCGSSDFCSLRFSVIRHAFVSLSASEPTMIIIDFMIFTNTAVYYCSTRYHRQISCKILFTRLRLFYAVNPLSIQLFASKISVLRNPSHSPGSRTEAFPSKPGNPAATREPATSALQSSISCLADP